MRINQLSWTSLLCRVVSHGIIPSRSLTQHQSFLLKSRVVILVFALFPPLKLLNSTVIVSAANIAPSLHIPSQPFLVCKNDMSKAPPIIGFSINCCQCTPADIAVVQDPMRARASECEAFSSCLRKTSTTSSWPGSL